MTKPPVGISVCSKPRGMFAAYHLALGEEGFWEFVSQLDTQPNPDAYHNARICYGFNGYIVRTPTGFVGMQSQQFHELFDIAC